MGREQTGEGAQGVRIGDKEKMLLLEEKKKAAEAGAVKDVKK